MPIVKLGDIDQYYEVHGRGSPIVLIAGYTCDHTFWNQVRKPLADEAQVIVFDNRAVGRSKDNGAPFSIETMAADTAALIAHLGLARPTIVGQSMGGAIAQTMLAKYPDMCGPCMIVNSTMTLSARAQMALQCSLALRKNNADADLLADAALPWLSGNAWLCAPGNVDNFKTALKTCAAPQSIADQARQLSAINAFDSRTFVRPRLYPTLVVSSADDILTTPQEGRALAEKLAVEYVELPGGHASPVEQPVRLAEIVLSFESQLLRA